MEESARAIVLAILQGLTEFLPISSSAHLILPARVLGWDDQGLSFDVAVHVGSLLAVIAYFRRDLWELLDGSASALNERRWNSQAHMVACLGVASIPVGLAGLLLQDFVALHLRSVLVIAVATIGFGLLLGYADKRGGRGAGLTFQSALWIGLAQALAIIPGTSRSGITMTAALLCGLDRQHAARFSFLLSIPVILAAGTLQTVELVQGLVPVQWGRLLLAVTVSAITAYLTIGWFLGLLDRLGFLPFVIYRCALGLVLLVFFL
jgi:undecaprenyl-diphosphatase